jgi:hypothetical protein
MTRFVGFSIAVFLMIGWAGNAAASLVGDDVIVRYIEQDTVYQYNVVNVQEGPSDVLITGFNRIALNMESSSMVLDFVGSNKYVPSIKFSGLSIANMNNPDHPDWLLLGVDVKTDMVGWTDSRIDFMNNAVGGFASFDWQGLAYTADNYFTAMFEFGPNPIPIPATMVLFVTGLMAFALYRKRKIRD